MTGIEFSALFHLWGTLLWYTIWALGDPQIACSKISPDGSWNPGQTWTYDFQGKSRPRKWPTWGSTNRFFKKKSPQPSRNLQKWPESSSAHSKTLFPRFLADLSSYRAQTKIFENFTRRILESGSDLDVGFSRKIPVPEMTDLGVNKSIFQKQVSPTP